jgi:KUP system potassium uptake protein
LTLAALGVVYGDIGTSPLYAIRECFLGPHAIQLTSQNVFGVLSLIVWSLVIVISIKYLGFVMRADNRGEGGILALMALIAREREIRGRRLMIWLGLFGAALLYGDGMLTPTISVLSAVEGLHVATSAFDKYVIPITIGILVALFSIQHRGTGRVGRAFGPVVVVWFLTIGALGLAAIIRHPAVLGALDPRHGVTFFRENHWRGYVVLGSVFLAVTGGEALYADMGHFGVRPIRLAWFALALPALLLNYFGQGAQLLLTPAAVENPFYHLAPDWLLYPLVILATTAAVIASQAVISGAFSLTRQAVQLGYSPRVEIEHTSSEDIGQIYVPVINWGIMVAAIGLVLGFRSSSALAGAYGVAVSTTMVITTILAYRVARELWGWTRWMGAFLLGGFLIVDLAFFGANILKVGQGGWFPLAIGVIVFALMTTWKRGRSILAQRLRASLSLEDFLQGLGAKSMRVPGIAVFMTQEPEGTPVTLLHNLKHNKVLHQRVVLLTILGEEVPYVAPDQRLKVEEKGKGFYRVIGRFGFMEDPNVPELLARAKPFGLEFAPLETTYFLGRETLIPSKKPGMAMWREHLFAFMARNAHRATAYFRIPPNRVVELGAQVEL